MTQNEAKALRTLRFALADLAAVVKGGGDVGPNLEEAHEALRLTVPFDEKAQVVLGLAPRRRS